MNNQYNQFGNNIQLINQAQQQPNQNIQFYHPQSHSTDLASQGVNYSYGGQSNGNTQNMRGTFQSQTGNLNVNNGVDMMSRDNSRKAGSKNRSGVRPSSATVAGQAGRFLSNQQSKRKYAAGQTAGGQSGQSQMTNSQVDQISYSYQPPSQQPMNQPMMNNLMQQSSSQALNSAQNYGGMNNLQVPQMGVQGSPNQFGSHRGSNQLLGQQQNVQRPPMGVGARKKTRPQSAARNQMQPAKALQSVTNFTYNKAKQNLNQKAYMPESLKNTDKERLYEEKISLKKQLNEMTLENQQLRTQLQSQQGHIKKKDEMVQHVMKQIFHPTSDQNAQQDTFLQEFQSREINHQANGAAFVKSSVKPKASAAKIIKNQNTLANKDSLISSLKIKMKQMAEGSAQKDKELADLKQTLKFTKIKEYETELALNVQESQRLRMLLEREMQKPRVDPRLFQALKHQNTQFQQIIQNPQQNTQIMAQNIEKLNQKLINQVNKFAKLKAARKRVMEKNRRLEKKVMILNNKVNQLQALNAQSKSNGRNNRRSNARRSPQRQQQEEDSVTKQNLAISKQIIDSLLAKMANCGIQVSEQELYDMQQQFQQDTSQMGDQNNRNEGFAGSQGDMEDDENNAEAGMDLIVTFGAPSNGQGLNDSAEAITKQMQGAQFDSYDHLKDTLRREFDISDVHELMIKYVNEHGSLMELSGENWELMKELSQTTQIQLAIEIINQKIDEEEEEASNYEDDFEEPAPPEKVFTDPVPFKDVKEHFEELKMIMQIKKVKRDDTLKFILHGVKDQDTGKKIKKISIECLQKQLMSKCHLNQKVASKLSRYLIEVPNEENKVEQMDDQDKELSHAQAVTIRRKDLQSKLLEQIKEFMIYNGLAITSLLNRIQGMFEDYATELLQELEDQDYDDEGTQPMDEIIKSMKLVGLFPDSWDEDILEFINFLAFRHSKSLQEIEYKDFMKAFDEDYSFIEDKKSIWEGDDAGYEPSSDEGELESSVEIVEASPELGEGSGDDNRNSGNIEDLDQNELLQKVDEILMQIVQKLPESQKIRSLTQYMTPYLITVFDQQQQRQYPIISQDAFIQFLLGQGQNQLGLQLDENHVICLLHLLVQEDEEGGGDDPEDSQTQNKFILFEEFIELVKTYMTKELILSQSKTLGINYDILSKPSVEFLFQIRSSLMHDNNQNINENSADEEDNFTQEDAKQKSVPEHVREIFGRIIQKKSISMSKGNKKPQAVEVIDFDQMLDTLFMRLGIHCPKASAQEELKFLMCLDFKYLEMVKLVKFDKIMHDLDYISIDLLRQAQDNNQEKHRRVALDKLKKKRDTQLSKLKKLEAQKAGQENTLAMSMSNQNNPQIYGTSSQQVEFQGVQAGPSSSTKQDKKRKRPDDKKQNLSKKVGQRSNYQNDMNIEASGSGNNMPINFGVEKAILPKNHLTKSNQDNIASSSGGKERYANNQKDEQQNRISSSQQEKKHYTQAGDNFDDIDVDLDIDINNLNKNDHQNQIAIAAQIAAAENISEFDDEYLQDDIPIDDDEEEDGIISDNYENLDDIKKQAKQVPFSDKDEVEEEIGSFKESSSKIRSKTQALEDNVISMDHSDDIDQSVPQDDMDMPDEVIDDSQNDVEEAIIDDDAEPEDDIVDMSGAVGQIVDDADDIDDQYSDQVNENINMENQSEPITESQVAESPSQGSIKQSIDQSIKQSIDQSIKSKSIKSEKQVIESSIKQSKSYKSSKVSSKIEEQSYKSSKVSSKIEEQSYKSSIKQEKSIKSSKYSQDIPQESIKSSKKSSKIQELSIKDQDVEVDNNLDHYSEIESNRQIGEDMNLDKVNFNQVDKDSSIQQENTHRDVEEENEDKYISQGSKHSQSINQDNFDSIPKPELSEQKSQQRSQFNDQMSQKSNSIKFSDRNMQESFKKSSVRQSQQSKQKSEINDEIEDSYNDDIGGQQTPSQKSKSIANSIRSSKSNSIAQSMKEPSIAPPESINDQYPSSRRSKTNSKAAAVLGQLAESSAQQIEDGSIKDEYEDDMMGVEQSIKSDHKSASRASQKRLNNQSTHNQLPQDQQSMGRGQVDDGVDSYVDDFGGGQSAKSAMSGKASSIRSKISSKVSGGRVSSKISEIQDDAIQSERSGAKGAGQSIQDEYSEEDLAVELPKEKQAARPGGKDLLRQSEEYVDDMVQEESFVEEEDYEF